MNMCVNLEYAMYTKWGRNVLDMTVPEKKGKESRKK